MNRVQVAFDACLSQGLPKARWTAVEGERLRDFRILEDEIAPQTVEVLKDFEIVPPVERVGRIRLVEAVEESGRVLGWKRFCLIGGELPTEHDLPTELPGFKVMGPDGKPRSMGISHAVTANAFVLPIALDLGEWGNDDLQELYLMLWDECVTRAQTARKNVEPVFHHEDENFTASVVRTPEGVQLKLSFCMQLSASNDTYYVYETGRTPPKLRAKLTEDAFEVGLAYPEEKDLVAFCEDLKAGRIESAESLDWERYDPARMEGPRRLMVIRCPSATVAFGVSIDFAGSPRLEDTFAKMKASD
jgi:hypothetical protein